MPPTLPEPPLLHTKRLQTAVMLGFNETENATTLAGLLPVCPPGLTAADPGCAAGVATAQANAAALEQARLARGVRLLTGWGVITYPWQLNGYFIANIFIARE
jgi:hypothetical protein